ncbi:MAG: prepilin-type N-terminal cleavage/methylation domain-containing protein [Bacteroidales bacterium]|nr:prepilin-type N-terminal cleavage/methylation domain-containing protein [Bacteroidales bacterium]
MIIKNKQKSFTLIELLVVIVIIGILAGVIMISTSSSIQKANIAKAQVFSESISNNLIVDIKSEYKLDDLNGAITSDSMGSFNATVGTAAFKSAQTGECFSKGCFYFDGGDVINIPFFFTSNQIKSGVTWELWTKTSINDTSSSRHYQILTQSSYSAGTYERAGAIVLAANKACFSLYDGAAYRIPCTNTINDSRWHNIVFTSYPDPDTLGNVMVTIYADGKRGQSVSASNGGDTGFINLKIGMSNGADVNHLDYVGFVDQVRLYNQTFLSSQIKQNYIAGLNSMLANGNISKQEYNERINALAYDN